MGVEKCWDIGRALIKFGIKAFIVTGLYIIAAGIVRKSEILLGLPDIEFWFFVLLFWLIFMSPQISGILAFVGVMFMTAAKIKGGYSVEKYIDFGIAEALIGALFAYVFWTGLLPAMMSA